jgi:type I restriction enzyme M protein
MWQKMSKSLGSKRKELSDAHIDRITQIFGSFTEAEHEGKPISRIFDNEDFGYHTITVDRPLRLRYRVTFDVVEMMKRSMNDLMHNLTGDPTSRAALALLMWDEKRSYESSQEFIAALEVENKKLKRPLKKADFKFFLNSCGEKDVTAEPAKDIKGELIPDPRLRDTENVPLSEDVAEYFKNVVLPHASDAWIDPDKTKVGYEIPFSRHFYVFTPPRSLTEIDAELKQTTARILDMIRGLGA